MDKKSFIALPHAGYAHFFLNWAYAYMPPICGYCGHLMATYSSGGPIGMQDALTWETACNNQLCPTDGPDLLV